MRMKRGAAVSFMAGASARFLFDAPEMVWDEDETDASPDYSEVTIDPRTPENSWLYTDFYDGVTLEGTAKKQLSQAEIDGPGPWELTLPDDLANGTYTSRSYTMDEDELVVTSHVWEVEDIVVNVVSATPTVVGYQEATYTSGDGTTATFTIPTTGLTAFAGGAAGDVQDGDTIIVFVNAVTSGVMTPSIANGTGMTFTSLPVVQGDDNNDSNLVAAKAIVSGAPASTITITGTAATNNSNAAMLVCLRDYTGTFDVTSVSASGNNEDAADPAAITPNTVGALVMAIYAAAISAANTNTYVGQGPSSGWENFHAIRASGGALRHALLAVQTQDWTSGAVDPPVIDGGVGTPVASSWTAYTIAITP